MASPQATARSPAPRRPVPASDLDAFPSAFGGHVYTTMIMTPWPSPPSRYPDGTLNRSWCPAVLDLRPGMLSLSGATCLAPGVATGTLPQLPPHMA